MGNKCFIYIESFVNKIRKGIKTTNNALCCVLLWANSQDFETDASTAFSVRTQKEVRERLQDVVSKGDRAAADLATMQRLLYETLKEQKTEQDERLTVTK